MLRHATVVTLALFVLDSCLSSGNSIKRFSVDRKSISVGDVSSSHNMYDRIARTSSHTIYSCLLECHYTGGCEIVTYFSYGGTCTMYNDTNPTLILVFGLTTQFARRSVLELPTPFDACDGHSCAVGERCLKTWRGTTCLPWTKPT